MLTECNLLPHFGDDEYGNVAMVISFRLESTDLLTSAVLNDNLDVPGGASCYRLCISTDARVVSITARLDIVLSIEFVRRT